MRYAAVQVVVLCGLVALAVALALGPVERAWGPDGRTGLLAAAAIGLGVALVAAIPVGLVATYHPQHAAMVAFASTAVRLLGTAGLGLGYQMVARPAWTPYAACLTGVYLVLLVAETALIALIVPRGLARLAGSK